MVCSPRLLAKGPPLRTVADLRHHTLLHDTSVEAGRRDWRIWLQKAGESGVDSDRGPGFSDANLILEAAIAGEGVALTRRSLAADDLAAGRLVIPFGPIRPTPLNYYIVYPKDTGKTPKVRRFIDWLHEEVASDRAAGRLTVKSGDGPTRAASG